MTEKELKDIKELGFPFWLDLLEVVRFRENGHLILRNFLNRESIKILRDRRAEKPFIINGWKQDELSQKILHCTRFAKLALDLLAFPEVRFLGEFSELYKAGEHRWKQDQKRIPINDPKIMILTIPLNHKITISVAEKSHVERELVNLPSERAKDEHFDLFMSARGYTTKEVEVKPGTGFISYGWTLKRIDTKKDNQILKVVYSYEDIRVAEVEDEHKVVLHKGFFGELTEGQIIEGEDYPCYPPIDED